MLDSERIVSNDLSDSAFEDDLAKQQQVGRVGHGRLLRHGCQSQQGNPDQGGMKNSYRRHPALPRLVGR
ncbi:MAG: hypothetical protein DWQ36_13890 [Acidobacteria bacterium]|nr:MAG: hypothetical protein DWQ30_20065 [Acidobacteriota bacterium]REK06299.1 MAG: hypothetical protein DWQ36_13890 [Acidobacteriota bacterium]